MAALFILISNLTPWASAEKANVVLVSIDTVRADHLGCYGYPRETSPALDAFARQAVTFRHAFAQAPWTLPSHMAVFTGQYPSANGVKDISKQLGELKYTLARILKINGYETTALVNDGNLKRHWGCDRGFDVWQEFSAIAPEGDGMNISQQAVDWLTARSQRKEAAPFFLFLHYFDPHDPYIPPPLYARRYMPDYKGSVRPEETAEILHYFRPVDRNFDKKEDLDYLRALYDGEIRYLDDALDKLLKAIQSLGFDSNTVVAVFSDHGEEFEEHLSTTHGATLYEEALRVPLLIRSPFSLKPGTTVDAPVELIDLMPTLLELLGLASFPGAQGTSRLELAMGGSPGGGFRLARAETLRVLEACSLKSLRAPRFKYIYSLLDGAEELYDLEGDPGEQKNIAAANHQAVLDFFRQEMKSWTEKSENFWRLRLPLGRAGEKCSGSLRPSQGQFGVIFPIGLGDGDQFSVSRNWDRIQFELERGEKEKGIYLELLNRSASLVVEYSPPAFEVRGGGKSCPFDASPQTLSPDEFLSSPFALPAGFTAKGDGKPFLEHYRGPKAPEADSDKAEELDEATREMLRTLGYIR